MYIDLLITGLLSVTLSFLSVLCSPINRDSHVFDQSDVGPVLQENKGSLYSLHFISWCAATTVMLMNRAVMILKFG